MITSEQIRAGRALLRWTASKLAKESGVSVPTVQRMESVWGVPKGRAQNLEKIQRAMEKAGVRFVGDSTLRFGVLLIDVNKRN